MSKTREISIENDYIVGGWEEPIWHGETITLYADEDDVRDFLEKHYDDDDELEQAVENFDYEDSDFIDWLYQKHLEREEYEREHFYDED